MHMLDYVCARAICFLAVPVVLLLAAAVVYYAGAAAHI